MKRQIIGITLIGKTYRIRFQFCDAQSLRLLLRDIFAELKNNGKAHTYIWSWWSLAVSLRCNFLISKFSKLTFTCSWLKIESYMCMSQIWDIILSSESLLTIWDIWDILCRQWSLTQRRTTVEDIRLRIGCNEFIGPSAQVPHPVGLSLNLHIWTLPN